LEKPSGRTRAGLQVAEAVARILAEVRRGLARWKEAAGSTHSTSCLPLTPVAPVTLPPVGQLRDGRIRRALGRPRAAPGDAPVVIETVAAGTSPQRAVETR